MSWQSGCELDSSRCFRKKNTLYIETEISVLKVRRGRRGVWAGAVVEVAQVSDRCFDFCLLMFCSIKFLLLNCDVLQNKGLWSFLSSGLLVGSWLDLLKVFSLDKLWCSSIQLAGGHPLYMNTGGLLGGRGVAENTYQVQFLILHQFFLVLANEWGKLKPYFPTSIVNIQYPFLSIFRITSLSRWNGAGRGLVRGGNRGWVASFFSAFLFGNFSFFFRVSSDSLGFQFVSFSQFLCDRGK